jgi:hypothetical protein
MVNDEVVSEFDEKEEEANIEINPAHIFTEFP